MKTNELTGASLDWAVCEVTGFFKGYTQFRTGKNFLKVWGVARNTHLHPSTEWSQGGPIIERERIELHNATDGSKEWVAHSDFQKYAHGPTSLIAAMRCFVASKMGDTVEIPEEIQNAN